jgi:hypothetical protein
MVIMIIKYSLVTKLITQIKTKRRDEFIKSNQSLYIILIIDIQTFDVTRTNL